MSSGCSIAALLAAAHAVRAAATPTSNAQAVIPHARLVPVRPQPNASHVQTTAER